MPIIFLLLVIVAILCPFVGVPLLIVCVPFMAIAGAAAQAKKTKTGLDKFTADMNAIAARQNARNAANHVLWKARRNAKREAKRAFGAVNP